MGFLYSRVDTQCARDPSEKTTSESSINGAARNHLTATTLCRQPRTYRCDRFARVVCSVNLSSRIYRRPKVHPHVTTFSYFFFHFYFYSHVPSRERQYDVVIQLIHLWRRPCVHSVHVGFRAR